MALRWIFTVAVVLLSFVLAGFFGGLVSHLTGLWLLPCVGFCVAFAVIVVASLAAPAYKPRSALITLAVGAIAAWMVLEPSFYPTSYGPERAYQPTHLPIVATYLGGLLGFVVGALLSRRAGPISSFKPTPLRSSS